MALRLTEAADIELQVTTHYGPQRDERLSWPGWLTYSGGLPNPHKWSPMQQLQVERRTAKDRRSTAVPHNQVGTKIWGPSSPTRGTAPTFLAMSVVAKRLNGSTCHLVWR